MSTMAIARDKFFVGAEKEEIVSRIIGDDELAKCLISTDPGFLDHTITDDERYALPYSHVFPCMFTIDTQTQTGSFITMRFGYRPGQVPSIWKLGSITIYVFCHKSLIATNYGMLRTDFMINRITSIMNDSTHNSWYNRMEFDGMDDTVIDDVGNYVGSAITFRMNEKWLNR